MKKQWIDELTTPTTWLQASERLCGSESQIAQISKRLVKKDLDNGTLTSIADYIAAIEAALPSRSSNLFTHVAGEPAKQTDLTEQAQGVLRRLRDAVREALGKRSPTESVLGADQSQSATEVISQIDSNVTPELTRLRMFMAQAAILPILLINGRGHLSSGELRALVANLAIVPPMFGLKSQSSCIEHHHGFNGLTGISVDAESGFGPSIDRAWQVAGLSTTYNIRKGTYLWRIEQFPGQKDLAFERFHNRSCEAAFVCALWAAAGGIPGDEDHDFLIDDLDAAAAVTATLDRDNLRGADTPLKPIAGFIDKLKAAAAAKLEVVVVAKEQMKNVDNSVNKNESKTDGERLKELNELHPEILKQVQIEEVETIRDVWEQLTISGRLKRWHQAITHEAWSQRYVEVDDDGKPIDTAPATAES